MEYIASISYGKDSLAMLEVIHRHNLPLDRIVHVEIMATNTIHADLPPMVAFKEKADKIIYEKYGIRVEHISSPKSYEDYFYSVSNGEKSLYAGKIYGFPMQKGNWCTGRLKQSVLQKVQRNAIVYIGIAIDEPKRFHNLTESKRSPLVEYEWTEKMCREWCEENGLLSPTYETSLRGGCWFCHNQSTAQLRLLRKQYPKLWVKLLEWDLDSPISFKGNGRTVHDYERRFQLEEQAKVPMDRTFRWGMMEDKSMIKHIYTAESVTCGHPDKLADLIADSMRVRRDHVPYDTWLGRGQVIATEGNVIHYGYIENFIEDLGTKYHIKEIAFDRWGAVQMVQNLEGMGFTVVPFGQGFKDMSPPTKELMKLVLEQKIAHGGNVPLRWMMDNVYVRTDPAGNIKMDKEKSTERIDGAVATVMALDRAIRNEGSTDSVYNERGIIVI